jgi:NAD(P)-dependent dehydrogenase (short-subunit alcohol dehydrogenase family)
VKLSGKAAVVTGAGRNVGAAIAMSFAAHGAQVAVVDLDEARASATAKQINAKFPGAAHVFICDVADTDSVRTSMNAIADRFGRLDILVNNVAITDRGATILDLDEGIWDQVLKVTLTSVFLCTKYAGQRMVAAGNGGNVINIGSTSGYRARPNAIAYPAAKAAVINMTRSIAAQLAPYGIRVNSVTPNKVGSPVGRDEEPEDRPRNNMLKRGGRPEDIAGAVLFLVSDDASFITSTDLVVDGGVLNGVMD